MSIVEIPDVDLFKYAGRAKGKVVIITGACRDSNISSQFARVSSISGGASGFGKVSAQQFAQAG
jgi:NAD(P)-dependent dehydrogenase (short-subunit alcohol dehydrogenase family)